MRVPPTAAAMSPSVAVVTGAASGIGRATALALARAGTAVVVADVDEAGGIETVRQLEAEGATARFTACDVSDEGDVEAAIHTATEAFGRLDVMVNNAGIEGPVLPVHAIDPGDWRRVFEVNVHGVFYGVRHALPLMSAAGGGVIVNVASVAGLNAFPMHAAYSASKHAVVGLTRTAALEGARAGVRVNAVCPGFTDTPMVAEGLEKMGRSAEDLLRQVPARRFARPDEVAAAVVYLASDAAAYVTGQTLAIDGGLDAG